MNTGTVFQHLGRSWRHHLPLQLATVAVLSVVLVILSIVFCARENLNRLNAAWGDNLELTLYFKSTANSDAVNKFVHDLEKGEKFSNVKFIGKEEAVQRFVSRMGHLAPEFLKSRDFENPLPSSVEIRLKDNQGVKEKVASLKQFATEFSKEAVVDDVSYGQGWIENWAGFLSTVQILCGGALFLTMVLGLLVIGNSVRVSLSQRRDEIEILELVGASPSWIRAPFIVEGAILGLLASMVAGLAGYSLQSLLFEYVKSSLQFWSVFNQLRPLGALGWVAVAFVGAGFGALGAYVCVRHLNSGWSAAERWNT
jgi:cell division transport system permease protein